MAKRIDPAKAKAKRDKIVAAVLGGVLLVASVIAVPMSLKQWKKLNGGEQTQSQPATPAPATPATGVDPLAPAPADQGIAGTVSAPVATGELTSFDLFESKDPFKPQVDVSDTPQPPPPVAGGAFEPVRPASQGAVPAGPVASPPAQPQPPPTAAVISVNGAPAEALAVGVEFPLPPAEALFRVVSLARGQARIAIVGGSYAVGAAAIALKLVKTLALENTADGTRYELKLLWVGTGAPPPGLVPPPPTAAAPTAAPSTPTSTP